MKNDLFIDTSGLFAFLVKKDAQHNDASAIIKKTLKEERRFVTTDYIIDETATLLKARGHGHILSDLFEGILSSKACRVEWMDREYFGKTKTLFLKLKIPRNCEESPRGKVARTISDSFANPEAERSLCLFNDHDWSFTDCFSFTLMRSAGIKDALTHDTHFSEAGFNPLLKKS